MIETKCARCGSTLDAEGGCNRCLVLIGLDSVAETGVSAGGLELRPDAIPGYEIQEVLGRGGMGVVYKARQLRLDRTVAIKVLSPAVKDVPGFAERFHREARAMANLSHQHIVAVHDFGEVLGLFYLVMEYVDGANLRQILKSGRVSLDLARAIVWQVCEALHYAHEEGTIHRDIKPENIFLDQKGRVKLGDFGLARMAGSAESSLRLTHSRHVIGTPHYMAPEQVNTPLTVDRRADIYSVGVVLYELLTGELPIGRFEPPSRLGAGDARFDAIVLRALEHKPEQRYQKISEIVTDLDRAGGASRIEARPEKSAPILTPPPLPATSSSASRREGWWIVLIILCALGALKASLNGAPQPYEAIVLALVVLGGLIILARRRMDRFTVPAGLHKRLRFLAFLLSFGAIPVGAVVWSYPTARPGHFPMWLDGTDCSFGVIAIIALIMNGVWIITTLNLALRRSDGAAAMLLGGTTLCMGVLGFVEYGSTFAGPSVATAIGGLLFFLGAAMFLTGFARVEHRRK